MGLSNELISQFVKATKDDKKENKETTVYGTIVKVDGQDYVQLDGSELLTPVSSTTSVKNGEHVSVMIKNHTAMVTGNISSPSASNNDLRDAVDQISEFEIVVAGKVSTDELDAEIARIDSLVSEKATIKDLTAHTARIETLEAKDVEITGTLTANKAEIDKLKTSKLDASVAKITYAEIKNLEATNADIHNLQADYANIEDLVAKKADIEDLTAVNGKIDNLESTKADITDLTAGNITFGTASGGILDVQTLLAQFTTGENAQYLNLTNKNAVIENAIIKDAMIDSISASKINAGTINTKDITLESDDNTMKIADGTIQFKDSDGKVRLQLGEDATGDFNFILTGTDGTTTLIDQNGIKEDAIADGLIKTGMINDQAITSEKIDYASFVSGLNEDGTAELIKSSKVQIDGTGQTLELAFDSLETSINDIEGDVKDNAERIRANTTNINVINGQIDTLVSATETIQGDVTTISNNYSKLTQNVNSISSTVSSHTTKITEVQNEVDNIQIGARNLLLNTAMKTKWRDYNTSRATQTLTADGIKITRLDSGMQGIITNLTVKPLIGDQFTLTMRARGSGVGVFRGTLWDNAMSGTTILFTFNLDDLSTTEFKTYSVTSTFDTDNSTAGYELLILNHSGTVANSWIEIEKESVKLEYGNKPTTWTKAPEEIDTQLQTITTNVTTNTSSINQLNNEIALKVSETEVTNIIANTNYNNLVPNSNCIKGFNGWRLTGGTLNDGFYYGVTVNKALEDKHFVRLGHSTNNTKGTLSLDSPKFPVVEGETLTLSTICSTLANVTTTAYLLFTTNASDINTDNTYMSGYSSIAFTSSSYTKKSMTVTVPATATRAFVRLRIAKIDSELVTGSSAVFSSVMVNRGSTPLIWTPCQEDGMLYTETKVSSVEQKITPTALTTTISTALNGTGAIDTTTLTMNKDGLTIKNGAIEIQNKNGVAVLDTDTNGNLSLTGSFDIDTTNDEMIKVSTNNDDVPLFMVNKKGVYCQSISVSESITQWNASQGNTSIYMDSSGHIKCNNLYSRGTITSQGNTEVLQDLIVYGKIDHSRPTTNPSSTYTTAWTKIATLSVLSKYGDSGAILRITSQYDSAYHIESGILKVRVKLQGELGDNTAIRPSMYMEGFDNLNVSNFKGVVVANNTTQLKVDIYMKVDSSYRIYHVDCLQEYGDVRIWDNQTLSTSTPSSTILSFSPTWILKPQEIRTNMIRAKTSTLSMYVSNESSENTGLYIASTGMVNIYKSGKIVHQFTYNGTKTGGTMEIEGVTYGMSPTDSPQTLIEYITPDIEVNGSKRVELDHIYVQMISYYVAFASNKDIVIAEKGPDYILLEGTGKTDLLIKGQRRNANEYFRIMGGLEEYSDVKEEDENDVVEDIMYMDLIEREEEEYNGTEEGNND